MKTDTILIIDDEKANLLVLNRILSPEYRIYTAKSGKEGLDRIDREKPDLILLDIIMPEIDGFQVLKQLKASEETRTIPVIIITSLDNESDEEKGLILGAVDYIGKPFKNAIVKARVRTQIQLLRQIRTIEQLGMIDGLTNIPNRRCFDHRIALEWRRGLREKTPLSFIMLDLDNFKTYNDTYGHPQGDTLLQSAAGLFSAAALRSTDLAARLGGEEFGLLLPDTDLPSALQIAEKIRLEVENARVLTAEGKTTRATVSIGVVSLVPGMDKTLREFISQADRKLYQAKNQGKNQVCA